MKIADSLAMGDIAVEMAKKGVANMVCLGVDFMAESVRAALDANGFQNVPASVSLTDDTLVVLSPVRRPSWDDTGLLDRKSVGSPVKSHHTTSSCCCLRGIFLGWLS